MKVFLKRSNRVTNKINVNLNLCSIWVVRGRKRRRRKRKLLPKTNLLNNLYNGTKAYQTFKKNAKKYIKKINFINQTKKCY
jgi:hypothetical protein